MSGSQCPPATKTSEKLVNLAERSEGRVTTLSLIQAIVSLQNSVIFDLLAALKGREGGASLEDGRLESALAASVVICINSTAELEKTPVPELLAWIDGAEAELAKASDEGATARARGYKDDEEETTLH